MMAHHIVHFDKIGGQHHAVLTEATNTERAIAEVRHDLLLCLPDSTTPAEFDAEFRNFKCDVPAEVSQKA